MEGLSVHQQMDCVLSSIRDTARQRGWNADTVKKIFDVGLVAAGQLDFIESKTYTTAQIEAINLPG
jgi:hypothetical protein